MTMIVFTIRNHHHDGCDGAEADGEVNVETDKRGQSLGFQRKCDDDDDG